MKDEIVERREPKFLLNDEIKDVDELVHRVINDLYYSVDPDVPTCRFRGTLVKRSQDRIDVVGWQRNVSRLQKMDVSLPTIIVLELDKEYVIKRIKLDPSFKGSKGLLCYQKYLDANLARQLLNRNIEETSLKINQVAKLHCFHIVEVLGGILSCVDLVREKKLDYFYEEEVGDSYFDREDFIAVGKQKMSLSETQASYDIVFQNVSHSIKFDENGTIYASAPFHALFNLNRKNCLKKELKGTTEKRLCHRIKVFSMESLEHVKKLLLSPDIKSSYMCSNLFFDAFIGLVIQAFAMKKYYNNYNYVFHSLNGIQRFGNIPRCVGAVESQEEADKYFPGHYLNDIFS
jgi:hypothetical protein